MNILQFLQYHSLLQSLVNSQTIRYPFFRQLRNRRQAKQQQKRLSSTIQLPIIRYLYVLDESEMPAVRLAVQTSQRALRVLRYFTDRPHLKEFVVHAATGSPIGDPGAPKTAIPLGKAPAEVLLPAAVCRKDDNIRPSLLQLIDLDGSGYDTVDSDDVSAVARKVAGDVSSDDTSDASEVFSDAFEYPVKRHVYGDLDYAYNDVDNFLFAQRLRVLGEKNNNERIAATTAMLKRLDVSSSVAMEM